jgi:hypothetical protein
VVSYGDLITPPQIDNFIASDWYSGSGEVFDFSTPIIKYTELFVD